MAIRQEEEPVLKPKKPEILERPVKVELPTTAKVPVRVREEVRGVSEKMATAMADPLYAMLMAARKQGINTLELQRMAGI